MNSKEAERWLKKRGIMIERSTKGSHLFLRNPANGKTSILPRHGSRQEIGKPLWLKIIKDLGLS